MLKDGMSLCSRCGRSTSGVECTNPGCQDALASARLAAVTAERDALKNMPPLMSTSAACRVHHIQCCHACDRADCGDNQTPSIVALRAELAAVTAQLAALKKRVADAVKSHAVSPWGGLSKGCAVGARTVDKPGRYALVRLEDGE